MNSQKLPQQAQGNPVSKASNFSLALAIASVLGCIVFRRLGVRSVDHRSWPFNYLCIPSLGHGQSQYYSKGQISPFQAKNKGLCYVANSPNYKLHVLERWELVSNDSLTGNCGKVLSIPMHAYKLALLFLAWTGEICPLQYTGITHVWVLQTKSQLHCDYNITGSSSPCFIIIVVCCARWRCPWSPSSCPWGFKCKGG